MSDKKKKEVESEIIKRLVAEFVMSGGEITQVADGMISTPTKLNQNDYYSKIKSNTQSLNIPICYLDEPGHVLEFFYMLDQFS